MNIAIIGSRGFTDYQGVINAIEFHLKGIEITNIVSGGAKGADTLGKRYAKEHNLGYIEFLPDWDKYGKPAGFIRNKDIVDNADMIIAFWDGVSKGTLSSINLAKKAGKKTIIITP